MSNTHRVITEVTFKVVLDVDKYQINASYPSDEYDDEIEDIVSKWAENTGYKFDDTEEVEVNGDYSELQSIKVISK